MTPSRLILPLVLLALGLGAPALPVAAQNEAFQATVSVADETPATRDPALREALGQVIARISGEAVVAQAGSVIAQAGQLVQHYSYARDETRALRLTAAFDPRAVEAALKAQNLPVWGVMAGPVEEVSVAVSGIRSAADYARVLASLKGIPGVKALRVQAAQADRLNLLVRTEGGAARLAGAVSIGGVLARDSGGGAGLSFTLLR